MDDTRRGAGEDGLTPVDDGTDAGWGVERGTTGAGVGAVPGVSSTAVGFRPKNEGIDDEEGSALLADTADSAGAAFGVGVEVKEKDGAGLEIEAAGGGGVGSGVGAKVTFFAPKKLGCDVLAGGVEAKVDVGVGISAAGFVSGCGAGIGVEAGAGVADGPPKEEKLNADELAAVLICGRAGGAAGGGAGFVKLNAGVRAGSAGANAEADEEKEEAEGAGVGRAARVVDAPIDDMRTPDWPLTISTSESPLRLSVMSFHRLVYGASWLSAA